MSALIPNCVRPHMWLNSVLELPAESLRQHGIRAMLLDVDCTLKNHGAATLNPGIDGWIESVRAANIQMCLLSNGKPRRIEKLAKQLDMPYVAMAFKPLPFGCSKAVRQLGVDRQSTAIVGDQIFADVMAGRLAGLFTVLVRPSSCVEPWFTRLKRPIERRVLNRLNLIPNGIADALKASPLDEVVLAE